MVSSLPAFAIAVKAFIVHDDKLLLLKRRPNDPHKPGTWDIPGGRLAPGENPFDGVRREAKEETFLDIHVLCPLGVQYFVRDDQQRITMILFYCNPDATNGMNIQLSEEHTEYRWVDIIKEKESIPSWLTQEVLHWKNLENKK